MALALPWQFETVESGLRDKRLILGKYLELQEGKCVCTSIIQPPADPADNGLWESGHFWLSSKLQRISFCLGTRVQLKAKAYSIAIVVFRSSNSYF